MPKIYEYFGIIFFFYSNEHEPVHVHGAFGKQESKAEFILSDGKTIEIRIMPVKGKEPLKGRRLLYFKEFIDVNADDIVSKWVDYFIYHKDVQFKKINKRVK